MINDRNSASIQLASAMNEADGVAALTAGLASNEADGVAALTAGLASLRGLRETEVPFTWNNFQDITVRDVMAAAATAIDSEATEQGRLLLRALGDRKPTSAESAMLLSAMLPNEQGAIAYRNFVCAIIFWRLRSGTLEEGETLEGLVRMVEAYAALPAEATLDEAQERLNSMSLDGMSGSWGDLIDVTTADWQRRFEAFGVTRDGRVVDSRGFCLLLLVEMSEGKSELFDPGL